MWKRCSGAVTNRKYSIEDWLIITCGVLLILFVCWMLTGCAANQTQAKVMYSNGCLITVEGITAAQAKVLDKDVTFGSECQMNRNETGTSQ